MQLDHTIEEGKENIYTSKVYALINILEHLLSSISRNHLQLDQSFGAIAQSPQLKEGVATYIYKWIERLSECKGPKEAIQQLEEARDKVSGICGASILFPNVGIKCNTCGKKDSIFCLACFENGNHQEHDFEVSETMRGSNAFCDCGSVNYIKPSGFCKNHGGKMDYNPIFTEQERHKIFFMFRKLIVEIILRSESSNPHLISFIPSILKNCSYDAVLMKDILSKPLGDEIKVSFKDHYCNESCTSEGSADPEISYCTCPPLRLILKNSMRMVKSAGIELQMMVTELLSFEDFGILLVKIGCDNFNYFVDESKNRIEFFRDDCAPDVINSFFHILAEDKISKIHSIINIKKIYGYILNTLKKSAEATNGYICINSQFAEKVLSETLIFSLNSEVIIKERLFKEKGYVELFDLVCYLDQNVYKLTYDRDRVELDKCISLITTLFSRALTLQTVNYNSVMLESSDLSQFAGEYLYFLVGRIQTEMLEFDENPKRYHEKGNLSINPNSAALLNYIVLKRKVAFLSEDDE